MFTKKQDSSARAEGVKRRKKLSGYAGNIRNYELQASFRQAEEIRCVRFGEPETVP